MAFALLTLMGVSTGVLVDGWLMNSYLYLTMYLLLSVMLGAGLNPLQDKVGFYLWEFVVLYNHYLYMSHLKVKYYSSILI